MEKPQESKQNVVLLENICSSEHYALGENKYRPVLENINLSVHIGENWAISSNDAYEAQLLLYILANVNPYYSGRCVLAQKGMMRKKRYNLPHLFFIGSHSMLSDKMTVLEYLMLVTAKTRVPGIQRQKMLLEHLVSIGLGYISLIPIQNLTVNEKLIIEIMVSGLSASCIIAIDLTGYTFYESEIKVLQKILSQLKGERRFGIILATVQPELIEVCCGSVLFMVNGRERFCGTLPELYREADKIDYIITHSDLMGMLAHLRAYLPEYRYEVRDGRILAYNVSGMPKDPKKYYRHIALHGEIPDLVEVNNGSVKNAFEELIRRYDI